MRNQIDFLRDWTAAPVGMRKVMSPLSDEGDRILFGTSRGEKCRAWWLAKSGYSTRLRDFLRAEQPDVLHAHFAGGGMIVRRSATKENVPLVVTLHGQDITAGPKAAGVAGAYYRFRLRRLFRDATILIAVSQHIKNVAIGLGADADKVIVHHIGIPVSPTEGSPPVQRQVLAVGRLIEKKGIAHLIGAMALLPPDLRDVTLRIVGDGPLEGELKALATHLGVNAEFMGFLPSASVRELMRARPVVCIPSVVAANGDEEGLPTVAMEAAAEKCAVVASRHSGLPDVVEHDLTGLLVPERDEAALASALTRLLREPDVAGSMGERGNEKILREFDMTAQTVLLESIYERARAHQV